MVNIPVAWAELHTGTQAAMKKGHAVVFGHPPRIQASRGSTNVAVARQHFLAPIFRPKPIFHLRCGRPSSPGRKRRLHSASLTCTISRCLRPSGNAFLLFLIRSHDECFPTPHSLLCQQCCRYPTVPVPLSDNPTL